MARNTANMGEVTEKEWTEMGISGAGTAFWNFSLYDD